MAPGGRTALVLALVSAVKAGKWLYKRFAGDATCCVILPPSSLSVSRLQSVTSAASRLEGSALLMQLLPRGKGMA